MAIIVAVAELSVHPILGASILLIGIVIGGISVYLIEKPRR